jgi:hypothetical protein
MCVPAARICAIHDCKAFEDQKCGQRDFMVHSDFHLHRRGSSTSYFENNLRVPERLELRGVELSFHWEIN